MTIENGQITVKDVLAMAQKLDDVSFIKLNNELDKMVKRVGANGHGNRIRFKSDIESILSIEKMILKKCVAEVVINKDEKLFGVENAVQAKQINIIMIAQLYNYHVWIRYDKRDNTATLEIRDKDIWRLCEVDESVLEILAKAERR